MSLWLLLTFDFIIQEPISTSALLLQAYQHHSNLWMVHLLFSVATLFDIVVGYYIGKSLYTYFEHHRILSFLKRNVDRLTASIGTYGKVVTLVFFSPLIFPVSAFIIPWFGISLTEALVYVFIGEWVFWYLPEWLLVLTTKAFVKNSQYALYTIVAISIILTLSIKALVRLRSKKK